jgi:hypothetical protein
LADLDFYTDELANIQEDLMKKLSGVVGGLSKLSDKELMSIASQIDLFEEMERLGYSDLISKVNNTYDDQIALVFSELSKKELGQVAAVSVTTLEQLKVFEMDYLTGGVKQYANQLKTAMLRALVTGEAIDDIMIKLRVGFGPGTFISTNQIKFLIGDAFARFQHTVRAKAFEQFPNIRFKYVGPTQGNRRHSCLLILRKYKEPLTREQISNLAKAVPPQQDGSRFFGFVDRGGYNCTHDWIRV